MNLRKKQQEHNKRDAVYVPKEIAHNFSSYKLSKEEHGTLSYSMDYHILSKITRNSLDTEFEMLLQNLLNHSWRGSSKNQNEIAFNVWKVLLSEFKRVLFWIQSSDPKPFKKKEIVILKQEKAEE